MKNCPQQCQVKIVQPNICFHLLKKKKKERKKEKIYGMYKKGPDASHQTQRYSGEQDGERGRTGRFFLFTLYNFIWFDFFLTFQHGKFQFKLYT